MSGPGTGSSTRRGLGNAALPAAAAGARVTASDLTPELLEVGRRQAVAAGLAITWETGDAEALPYDDDTFDRGADRTIMEWEYLVITGQVR